MGLRYASLDALRKAISPDVQIVDEPERPMPEAAKAWKKAANNVKVLEDKFLANWNYLGGVPLQREHKFHLQRKWRFDFAHLPTKTAFEIQGGLYKAQSGHRSKEGVSRDYEKMNEAQRLGWKVFSVTSENLQDAAFMDRLITYVKQRSKEISDAT